GFLGAVGANNGHGEDVEGVAFEQILRQDDFGFVTFGSVEVRHDSFDRVVATGVAVEAFKSAGDVFQNGVDAVFRGQFTGEFFAERIRVLVRHHDRDDSARAEGADGERKNDGGVNAAADADNSAAPHILADILLNERDYSFGFFGRVEV